MKHTLAFLLIAFAVSCAKAQEQSIKQIDARLARYLNRIICLDRCQNCDTTGVDYSDSIQHVNDQLYAYMRKVFEANPATLTADFKHAKKNGLDYVTSEDGNLRFYDWDMETGGTMHFFMDVAEYKTDAGVKVVAKYDGETGFNGCYYHQHPGIAAIHAKDKTVYVTTFGSIGSNQDEAMGIAAYALENNTLIRVPFFRVKKKLKDHIDLGYNRFAGTYGNDLDNEPEIHLSGDKQKLYIPIKNKNDGLTKRFTIYEFDGESYVLVKGSR
ncbi:MAG TPA: hypothetical protein VFA55_10570 [Candidatus Kapabacteria bacterium]|nr:hypothetical protein [Candidatus Kapabacteria bacterium]